MKRFLLVVTCLGFMFAGGSAKAWGEPGHQVIGSIAQQILAQTNPSVAQKVGQLLGGFDLSQATTWADCARDVHSTHAGFRYYAGRMTPKVCDNFSDDEKNGPMVDYVSRNWTQCSYTATEGCLGTYHFADVAIQRDGYNTKEVGTSDHDIVSTINMALAVLKNPNAPVSSSPTAPKIVGSREALLLIAHMVGDLHQPLHVGAVYLDPDGELTDPDTLRDPDSTATRGGNSISFGSGNLHASWDRIPTNIDTVASKEMVGQAISVPKTAGDASTWAALWATDTVRAAKAAFQGLTFSGEGDEHWQAEASDLAAYRKAEAQLQTQQLIKGGAHLAQILAAALN